MWKCKLLKSATQAEPHETLTPTLTVNLTLTLSLNYNKVGNWAMDAASVLLRLSWVMFTRNFNVPLIISC